MKCHPLKQLNALQCKNVGEGNVFSLIFVNETYSTAFCPYSDNNVYKKFFSVHTR